MNDPRFFADNGHHNEVGTTPVTGSFYEIRVYEAATFTTLTSPKNVGDAWTGYSIAAGTVIPGPITAFTLSSGKVVALKNPPALN